MRIIFSTLIFFLIISCKQPKERIQNSAAAQDSIKKASPSVKLNFAISGLSSNVDPECGMKLNQKMLEDTALINGKFYGFCGTGCKEEYLKKLLSKK